MNVSIERDNDDNYKHYSMKFSICKQSRSA